MKTVVDAVNPAHGTEQEVLLVLVELGGFRRYTVGSRTAAVHGQGLVKDLLDQLVGQERFAVARREDNLVLLLGGKPEPNLSEVRELAEAFHRRMRELMAANSCACEACQHLDRLRLRMVAHAGKALLWQRNGQMEVSGSTVSRVHRLRENGIAEPSYLLLTAEAQARLQAGADFEPVELGLGEAATEPAFLLELDRGLAGNLPAAGGFRRLGLVVRKLIWDFRYRREA